MVLPMCTTDNSKQMDNKLSMASIALGIDLGTTNTCAAYFDADSNEVKIIPNTYGDATTPSVVSFTESNVLVGKAAQTISMLNLESTFYDIKRFIGRRGDELTAQEFKRWPFKMYKSSDGRIKLGVRFCGKEQEYAPEQISSQVLFEVKQMAEAYLKRPVKKAVVTVPAYFNNSQRQATKDAAQIAGLEVLHILHEPTAAAIAYGLQSRNTNDQTVLVADLGGATFDVTILRITHNVFDVLATTGDANLGGEDFDDRLEEYFARQFERQHHKHLEKNSKARQMLRRACEQAKRELACSQEARIEVNNLIDNIGLSATLTLDLFESLTRSLVDVTIEHVKKALEHAKLDKKDIQEIVLVGGSTRSPVVQARLKQFFEGRNLCRSINPDEAVAVGAAYQAATLSGLQIRQNDPSSSMPGGLNVRDLTPMSLGTVKKGGGMAIIVPKNTRLPVKHTKTYWPNSIEQRKIVCALYQGEALMAADNLLLGTFELQLPPAKDVKDLQFDFTIEVDENGILKATAKLRADGQAAQMTILNYGHLPQAEVDEMIAERDRIGRINNSEETRQRARRDFETNILQIKRSIRAGEFPQLGDGKKEEIFEQLDNWLLWIDDNAQESREVYQTKMNEFETFCEEVVFPSGRPKVITELNEVARQ